ncbi:MAG: hypothetical protein ISS28_02365 [Candidatus Cloacimonetes bacterium]|nr:hypothetical protein [Candidatus Cloacimonadota bacterium]
MFQLRQNDISVRSSVIFLGTVITLLSIIAIGNYNIRLAAADTRTAGVFSTYLLMYPERYVDDIARLLTPLGYINPLVMIQYFLFKALGVDPYYISYIFVIGASVTLYLGIFYLAFTLLKDARMAIITAFFAFIFALPSNNFAMMFGRFGAQVFPDMNCYALGLVAFVLAFLYKDRWGLAMICMLGLIAIHTGHALLLSPMVGIFFIGQYFFVYHDKKLLFKQLMSITVILILSTIPALVMLFSAENLIDNQHIYNYVNGLTKGHIYPWENEFSFIPMLSSYGACIALFLIGRRYYSRIRKAFWILFYSILAGSVMILVLHICILYFDIVELVRFTTLQPLRATVYLPLLIFPFICYMITSRILEHQRNFLLKLLIILFCVFCASFSSLGFWFFIPFFIMTEFKQNKSDKKNIEIFKRNVLISMLIFFSCVIVSLIINRNYSFYEVFHSILFTSFNYENIGINEKINLIRLISGLLIVSVIIFFLQRSNFVFKIINKVRFLRSFQFHGALLLICIIAFSTLHSLQTFGATFLKKPGLQLYEAQKWMNENTPEKAKFITNDWLLQQNGISARATLWPYPYALGGYRIQDLEYKKFSEKIFSFWDFEVGEKHGWIDSMAGKFEEKYYNLNEDQILKLAKEHNASYFVTSPEIDELNFETVFQNRRHRIYFVE